MSTIDELLKHDLALWVGKNTEILHGRSRYCALNSIRFLNFASDTFEISPIVSAFCALNALEEAVASFVSAAKSCGHRDYAKDVNIHDHKIKALVSIIAQRITKIVSDSGASVAIRDDRHLAFRLIIEGKAHYGDLSLSIFRPNKVENESFGILLGEMPSLAELRSEVQRDADARNKLLYASDGGIPSGFVSPEAELVRAAKLSLGMIWAAIDIHLSTKADRPFVDEMLKQIVAFSKDKKKQNCDE